jgi:hypothetical protein
MKRSKSGLSGLNALKMVAACRSIIARLEANPFFPALPYTTTEATAEVEELLRLQMLISTGHTHLVSLRKAQETKVRNIFSALCDYVNATAKGDGTMLESSGFPEAKNRAPRPTPDAVQRLSASQGHKSRSVKLTWLGSKLRTGYTIQKSYDPLDPESWKEVTSQCTKTHIVIEDLDFGRMVSFRVAAFNTAGVGDWSNKCDFMVS